MTRDFIFRNIFADIQLNLPEESGQGAGQASSVQCYYVGHLDNRAHSLDAAWSSRRCSWTPSSASWAGIEADPDNLST